MSNSSASVISVKSKPKDRFHAHAIWLVVQCTKHHLKIRIFFLKNHYPVCDTSAPAPHYQLQGIKGRRLGETSSGIISIPSFMKISSKVERRNSYTDSLMISQAYFLSLRKECGIKMHFQNKQYINILNYKSVIFYSITHSLKHNQPCQYRIRIHFRACLYYQGLRDAVYTYPSSFDKIYLSFSVLL